MSQNKTAVIIYNNLAGRGKALRYAKLSKNELETKGWIVKDLIQTEYAGHAERELSPKWSVEIELIVVVAGDGTLREVCAGLDQNRRKVLIAFIPIGNGNVIDRESGIPLEQQKAIKLLTEGEPTNMDVGILKLKTAGASCSWL